MRTRTFGHWCAKHLLRKRLTELDLRGNRLQSLSNLHHLGALKSLDLSESLVSDTTQ